jgi:hypothetical protein
MSKKLNDEEYNAFLKMLDGPSVQIRKMSNQGRMFRASFSFINAYSLSVIFIFFIMTSLFSESFNKAIFTEDYISVLQSRAYASLWLIAGFNIAFYFRFYFVFFAILMIMYLVNATIDQSLMFYMHSDLKGSPFLLAFYFTRPLLILALIVAILKYDDQQ